ncbi:hypothetical protein AgCh_017852 [Apium graveolens]
MDPNLLEPIKDAQEQLRTALRLAHVTDDKMEPTAKERERSRALSDYQLGMRNILRVLSNAQKLTFAIPEYPTHLEIALVEEIDSMEQKFHNMLPPDLRNKKDETGDLENNHEVFVKCYLDSLNGLERAMTLKFNEIKAEEEAQKRQAKARAKKDRRKERTSQQQKSIVQPEIKIEGEARHGFDKEDAPTEKTCIPHIPLIQYSSGVSTNISCCIFEGKVTIPVPSSTTDKEPIAVMYFKLEKLVYGMSGFWWAKFSMQYPSINVLTVYGAGETVDDQYFIACETFEQSLANWLNDSSHFSQDKPLSSTLKSFFRDVINGASDVHNQSKGILGVELSINNIFIVNGRAKLSLFKHATSDTTTFGQMVKTEVYESKPIPVELYHLLKHMRKYSWHVSCVTHPFFLSASQTCMYVKIAHERIQASPSTWPINKKINSLVQVEFDDNFNWIAEVQHPILLGVLNFKKNKVQDSGATKTGTGNEKGIEEVPKKELDTPLGEKVEAGEGEIEYDSSPSSFLKFYRNLIVHAKKGALTNEEIVFEMNKIIPNFLLYVHGVLTDNNLFVSVGEDLTS